MAAPFRDLTGRLLIAHASLHDPNFRRTVIFLCQHDVEDGSFGVILNRRLEQTAADFLPENDAADALTQVPAFQGGPVAGDRLIFTNFTYDSRMKVASVQHALGLEQVCEILERGEPGDLRAFVGYAGWTEGQLESEIEQGAWILADPVADSFALDGSSKLWAQTLFRLGGEYQMMAVKPEDPSLN